MRVSNLQSIGCLLSWFWGRLGVTVHWCPTSQENTVSHTAPPAKDENSKFKVQFLLNAYYFCTTVKSKNLNRIIVSQGPSMLESC